MFKLGQQVFSIYSGWGIVKEIEGFGNYPIEVRFYDCTHYFTTDGKAYIDDNIPTIYHEKVEIR